MVGYLILIDQTEPGETRRHPVGKMELGAESGTHSRACIRFCALSLLFLRDGLSKRVRDQAWVELDGEEMPALQNTYIFLYKTSIKLLT